MVYRYLSLKQVPLDELKQYIKELDNDIKDRNNEKLRVNREIKNRNIKWLKVLENQEQET